MNKEIQLNNPSTTECVQSAYCAILADSSKQREGY